MKVTINDIAKAANVAKSTVSKVLNDSPSIPLATKERIRAIMREMNYIPSSMATGLAKRKCNNVAVMIDLSRRNDFLNQFFYNIIGGIESVVGSKGYDLTICNVPQGDSRDFLHRYALSQKADGLIIDTSILEKQAADDLLKAKSPFVVLGAWGEALKFPCVDIDNRLGAVKITEHLLAEGYRRIAFIGGRKKEYLFSQRFSGYSEALRRQGYGVNPLWSFPEGGAEESGYAAAEKMLRLPIVPDAVICMNNYVAFGALRCLRDRGISVPDEMGIVTFDNEPLAPYTSPTLTSLHTDTFGLGTKAAELLMDLIQDEETMPDEEAENRQTWIEPQLIVRESSVKSGSAL
ncbi:MULTISPECIES: LacI family DNA-binding transcriptional regulator [Paenibacillus]|uniref:LacI family DNA-binding transcriptional regulator n=1 Tax=Paenibacillus TaxID=44249 RepID=UPI002FE135EC